jgi:tRNA dimethylallyltransferase
MFKNHSIYLTAEFVVIFIIISLNFWRNLNKMRRENFRELAIIGATASGKSRFATELAEEIDANILSLDSLSIYKEIDIASAKPSREDLEKIIHFGVDEIYPNQKFSVALFLDIYRRAKEMSLERGKNLIIVGGTGFYLKTLFEGLSPVPEILESVKREAEKRLEDLEESYSFLEKLDPIWADGVKSVDRYRVEKALHLYLQTGETPTQFFRKNPPQPVLDRDTEILNIFMEREKLREKIGERTEKMWEMGLLDEVKSLVDRYGKDAPPMGAIGIKETIQYLEGEIDKKDELLELISIHTAQLAKRQRTFNRTQFREFNIRVVENINQNYKFNNLNK